MILLTKINSYLLLTVFGFILYWPGMLNLPVIDRDEAHFAQASRQMLLSGQYFQIRFQDITRFQKPPGINWLQAASVNSFGKSNERRIGLYRLPSLLSAIFSLWLIYAFSKRRFGHRVALLAAALLGASILMSVEAHMAVIDTSLLSSVILMQGALWRIMEGEWHGKRAPIAWALLFWLALSYGFVLKGVTPLVGGLSLLTLCIVERSIKPLQGVRFVWGFALFVLLSALWLMKVNAAEHSNYLWQMFHKDLLPKLQGGHESHGQPPLFHLAILPLTFWPGSLFLWQGVQYAWFKRHENAVRFLLAWLLPSWIFFELMPTKLPQYVLPMFPVIALFCALSLYEGMTRPKRSLFILQCLWGVLSLGLVVAIASIPYLIDDHFLMASVLLCLFMGGLSIVAMIHAIKGMYRRAAIAAVMAAVVGYPLIYGVILPKTEGLWLSKQIVSSLPSAAVSNQTPLIAVGFAEPSLVMQLAHDEVIYVEDSDWTLLKTRYPGSLFLIDKRLLDENAQQGMRPIAKIRGFNYSKGRWLELWVLQFDKRGS